MILDVIDPPECDEYGFPLDWDRCRTCEGDGGAGGGGVPCRRCEGHGSLKAAALAGLEERLRRGWRDRRFHERGERFDPDTLPEDRTAALDQIHSHATTLNRHYSEDEASFVYRCEDCWHPMHEGTWEGDLLAAPRREGNLMERESAGGGFVMLPEDAPMEERQYAHRSAAWTWIKRRKEPAEWSHVATHYSSCDERCKHSGPRRADAGLIETEWVYKNVDGSDIEWVAGPAIQASWRPVDVRALGWPHDLRLEKLAVLCLRCYAERIAR